MKIRKGDKVQVISGAYKGTVADVTRVLPKENKVVVEGVNIIKKHMKPTQQDPDGKIIEREAPIHVSNVAIVDPKTKKPVRVGYRFEEVDGKTVKVRVTTGRNASGAKLDK